MTNKSKTYKLLRKKLVNKVNNVRKECYRLKGYNTSFFKIDDGFSDNDLLTYLVDSSNWLQKLIIEEQNKSSPRVNVAQRKPGLWRRSLDIVFNRRVR
jgi:hypothetical protein